MLRTTIAVAVTVKVDAEGDTPEALIQNALDIAMMTAEAGAQTIVGVSVEGATALVDREALGV